MKKIFRKLPFALAMLLVAACNDGIKSYDGLYIVGTQGKEVTTTLTVDDVPSAIAVNVAASELAKENINVELKAAPELVESFNKEHHKNYVLLPQTPRRPSWAASTFRIRGHSSPSLTSKP